MVLVSSCISGNKVNVSLKEMQEIFHEVETLYKYGLVLVPGNDSLKLDCPFIFREDSTWYMTYIVFNGRGYETWLTRSTDLLSWSDGCRIMSFSSDSLAWDASQRAGYPALGDVRWGGSYQLGKYSGRYWMSYLGGRMNGYEEGPLSIGIASSADDPSACREWNRLDRPVLSSADADARWWEDLKLYKSTVICDDGKITGHNFIMYYNAYGDSLTKGHSAERIGMAVSDDMIRWKRFMAGPVLNHYRGITGDPQVTRIGNIWVMFYFGAFWNNDKSDGAFDRFACSYDLRNWTDWTGKNLVEPSESFDSRYAHKPFIVKWNGIVYHFYCAVNGKDQRGIALATSKDIGRSHLFFFSGRND